MNALILFLYSETIVCAVRPVCLFNNLTRILPWDLESFFNSFENSLYVNFSKFLRYLLLYLLDSISANLESIIFILSAESLIGVRGFFTS